MGRKKNVRSHCGVHHGPPTGKKCWTWAGGQADDLIKGQDAGEKIQGRKGALFDGWCPGGLQGCLKAVNANRLNPSQQPPVA